MISMKGVSYVLLNDLPMYDEMSFFQYNPIFDQLNEHIMHHLDPFIL